MVTLLILVRLVEACHIPFHGIARIKSCTSLFGRHICVVGTNGV